MRKKGDSVEHNVTGLPISEGIAIGRLCFLKEQEAKKIPQIQISIGDVEEEIQRYRRAIRSSRLDLEEIQINLAQEGSIEAVTIIDSHIRMLEDPFMTTLMEERIRKQLLNTEAVFQSAVFEYEKQFNKIKDAFFRQRLIDVKDLSHRILKHLYPDHDANFKAFEENTILLAKEFSPSLVAEVPMKLVSGLIAPNGSQTSHAGLIARAKGIPFLSQIDLDWATRHEGQLVIVDANNGLLILNPKEDTLKVYSDKKVEQEESFESISKNLPDSCATLDGRHLRIQANLDSIHDVEQLKKYKADGIGLFRSEFLFFEGDHQSFKEEYQEKLYTKLFDSIASHPMTFRVFDFGGDKKFRVFQEDEVNPALGLRSMRFLMRYKELFRTQLRAVFKAAHKKKLNLLLPFIADVEEFLDAKNLILQIQKELSDQVTVDLKVGAMIEMPSAVMLAKEIAHESDFLSIGTNDLIQYTLAVDRQNPLLHDIYKPAHPSLIRMLKLVMDASKEVNTPVCLCGEMASNPLFTPLLIGLGFDTLSCSLRYIPKIKKMASHLNFSEVEAFTKSILQMKTATEVHRALTDFYCHLHQMMGH